MIAYAQLEVMAMLPSLRVAKLQAPARVDEADLKVRALPCRACGNPVCKLNPNEKRRWRCCRRLRAAKLPAPARIDQAD